MGIEPAAGFAGELRTRGMIGPMDLTVRRRLRFFEVIASMEV
jgi:hypothetical protein